MSRLLLKFVQQAHCWLGRLRTAVPLYKVGVDAVGALIWWAKMSVVSWRISKWPGSNHAVSMTSL